MPSFEELHPRRVARARRIAARRISSREYAQKGQVGTPDTNQQPQGLRDAIRASYSSSLLEDLWNRTPEPDYELVKAANRKPSTKAKVVAGMIAVVLGFTGALATVKLREGSAQGTSTREYLTKKISAGTEANDKLALKNAERSSQQQELRRAAIGEESAESESQLAELAAAQPIKGKALILVLKDQRSAPEANNPRDNTSKENVVQDVDIQTVVNYLFAAGAQGIAINNHRLSNESAIRSAGSAILVNFTPLAPPYEIVAVGPDNLRSNFAQTVGAQYLGTLWQDYGISTDVSAGDREIPAADVGRPRYARDASRPAPTQSPQQHASPTTTPTREGRP